MFLCTLTKDSLVRFSKRRSCAFYRKFDHQMLRVRNIVKLPQVCEVGEAEELAQSPLENHVDDDTSYDFQENEFEENRENQKRFE